MIIPCCDIHFSVRQILPSSGCGSFLCGKSYLATGRPCTRTLITNRPFHSIPCICITLVSTIATNSIFLLVGVKTERRSNVREDGLFVGVQRTIRYLRRKGTLFVVGSVNASKGQKTNCSHGDSVGHASRNLSLSETFSFDRSTQRT